MKKKLNINDLKINSFVTNNDERKVIKGGSVTCSDTGYLGDTRCCVAY